jgi:hypothetical protein
MTLAGHILGNHTWWDIPHLFAFGLVAVVAGLTGVVIGAVFLGTRMVRAHSHGGFRFIAAILHRHRRLHIDEVKVAFDPDLAEERNRRMSELRVPGGGGDSHPQSGGDGD